MPQGLQHVEGNPIQVLSSPPCCSSNHVGQVLLRQVPKVRTFGVCSSPAKHKVLSTAQIIPETWGHDHPATQHRGTRYPPGTLLRLRLLCMRLRLLWRRRLRPEIGGNVRILASRRASGEASLMNDGLLGPRLVLGHGAPMLKRGLAGAVAFRCLFCHNDEKVSFSNDPPRRGGRGPDLSETKPVSLSNDPPRRGGRGPDLPEMAQRVVINVFI